MLPKLLQAKYQGDYHIWLKFADGVEGTIDLENELWGEVFEPLKDKQRFAEVRFDGQTEPTSPPSFCIRDYARTMRSSRRRKAERLSEDKVTAESGRRESAILLRNAGHHKASEQVLNQQTIGDSPLPGMPLYLKTWSVPDFPYVTQQGCALAARPLVRR